MFYYLISLQENEVKSGILINLFGCYLCMTNIGFEIADQVSPAFFSFRLLSDLRSQIEICNKNSVSCLGFKLNNIF